MTGRSKTARDAGPVDAAKVTDIMAFLTGKLSDEDLGQVENMLDDLMDDAIALAPMGAQDSVTPAVDRQIRRSIRRAKLGLNRSPTLAQDSADFDARFPNARRLGAASYSSHQSTLPRPAHSARPSASEDASFRARFPDAGRLR